MHFIFISTNEKFLQPPVLLTLSHSEALLFTRKEGRVYKIHSNGCVCVYTVRVCPILGQPLEGFGTERSG